MAGQGEPSAVPRIADEEPDRPFVAIIGTGAAGSALALALATAGWPAGLLSRDAFGRSRAEACGVEWLGPAAQPHPRMRTAPIVVLAVRDAQIAALAADLAPTHEWDGRVALHLSGALPSTLLAPLAARGARVASLHPLTSLATSEGGPRAIPESTPFFVEGDDDAVAVAREMALSMRGEVHRLARDAKPLYHAAATIAGNLVAALHAGGGEILRSLGVEQPERVLEALAGASVRATAEHGGLAGLTGPLARGDAATLAANVEALRGARPSVRRAHAAVSLLALDLLREAGREPALAAEMEQLLRGVLRDTQPTG